MDNKEQIRQGLQGSPKVKKFLDWIIMNRMLFSTHQFFLFLSKS